MTDTVTVLIACVESPAVAEVRRQTLDHELEHVRAGSAAVVTVRDCCGQRSAEFTPSWCVRKAASRSPESLAMTHELFTESGRLYLRTTITAEASENEEEPA